VTEHLTIRIAKAIDEFQMNTGRRPTHVAIGIEDKLLLESVLRDWGQRGITPKIPEGTPVVVTLFGLEFVGYAAGRTVCVILGKGVPL
jgi:hypothetical protein